MAPGAGACGALWRRGRYRDIRHGRAVVGHLGVSLINKVLQDLEARRTAELPRTVYEDLHPVRYAPSAAARRRAAWLSAGIVALAGAVLGAYYLFGLHQSAAPPVASHERTIGAQNHGPSFSPSEMNTAVAEAASEGVLRDEAPMSGGTEPAVLNPVSSSTKLDSEADTMLSPDTEHPRALAHREEVANQSPMTNAAAVNERKADVQVVSRVPVPDKPPPGAAARPRIKTPAPIPARKPAAAQIAISAPGDGQVEKNLKPLTPAEQAEGHYRRALAWLEQGETEKAEEALRAALAAHPGMAAARELLAGLLLQRGHARQAQALLEEGVKLRPEPSLARLLARLLVEQGAQGEALRVMEGARDAASRDAQYLSFLALLYQHAGRHAEAIAAYTEALGFQPADGRSWLGLAISLEAQQKHSEAASAYERALAGSGLDSRLRQYAQQRLEKLK